MARVGTVRKFKKVDGLSPTAASNRMRAVLGGADEATTLALHTAPAKTFPRPGEILRAGYGNLRGDVADEFRAVRAGVQGGWAPFRQGFGGYSEGGPVAFASRGLGMHDNAAEIAKLGSARDALAGAGHALRPQDAARVDGLARQGLGQVVMAGSGTLSGGGRDAYEVGKWATGRG